MDIQNKCCGNCKNFSGEDIFGNGICLHTDDELHCSTSICQYYEPNIEGWAEITSDNMDKVRKNRKNAVIMNPKEWNTPKIACSITTDNLFLFSKWGGYYYYILPELKIE